MPFAPKFRTFHQKIHLGHFKESALLRQKRDRVLDTLRRKCPVPFDFFNQGSYAMGTGIKPKEGDYDIDVGIIFSLESVEANNPLHYKRMVYDAVKMHTSLVYWKEPCITVQYQQRGEPAYHVDLAIYGRLPWGELRLARGKQHSSTSQVRWENSDPKGLISRLGHQWSGEDKAQFRRVVQYLKRWRDEHFPATGNAAPVGIGLTLLAHQYFQPSKASTYYNAEFDDFLAIFNLVSTLASLHGRIQASVPVEPYNDVFAKMTNQQMEEFQIRIHSLRTQLERAKTTNATVPLVGAFGSDFPQ